MHFLSSIKNKEMTIQALSEPTVWHSSSALYIQMLRIWLIALVAVACFNALIIKALITVKCSKIGAFL